MWLHQTTLPPGFPGGFLIEASPNQFVIAGMPAVFTILPMRQRQEIQEVLREGLRSGYEHR
jgi:hypothetical protein